MSDYRFSSVAQLEQHMNSKIKKNHTLFTVEFKRKVIASYLNKQKPDIPLRHKSYVFFEKLTGILTAAKSGFKLPIYGIIPRKNPLPLDPTKVILKYKTGSTFDKEVIKDWLELVISRYLVSQGYSKILLIIDQATCHKKLTESYDLIEKGIHVLYITGRMTGFLQPADVGWFATIKKCSQMLNNVDGASHEKN